jgi:hypothetical protein
MIAHFLDDCPLCIASRLGHYITLTDDASATYGAVYNGHFGSLQHFENLYQSARHSLVHRTVISLALIF